LAIIWAPSSGTRCAAHWPPGAISIHQPSRGSATPNAVPGSEFRPWVSLSRPIACTASRAVLACIMASSLNSVHITPPRVRRMPSLPGAWLL
jgi:hypothetical protein